MAAEQSGRLLKLRGLSAPGPQLSLTWVTGFAGDLERPRHIHTGQGTPAHMPQNMQTRTCPRRAHTPTRLHAHTLHKAGPPGHNQWGAVDVREEMGGGCASGPRCRKGGEAALGSSVQAPGSSSAVIWALGRPPWGLSAPRPGLALTVRPSGLL